MPIAELPNQASSESVRIHYQLDGDANLPVLVLSNSLGVTLDMWKPQLASLTPQFRVLRYDTRGHGESSLVPGPYSVEALGQDVLGLLNALEIDSFCFCGLSMGGATGQWLALHSGDRLKKLVLANTAAKIGKEEVWNARIAEVKSTGVAPIIPGTLDRWFTQPFRKAHPKVVSQTAAMLERMNALGYVSCCAAVRDFDLRTSLSEINVPTLVISGSEDPVTPPSEGRFLADTIPNALFRELPAAHLSNVEAAEQFTDHLLHFLADGRFIP